MLTDCDDWQGASGDYTTTLGLRWTMRHGEAVPAQPHHSGEVDCEHGCTANVAEHDGIQRSMRQFCSDHRKNRRAGHARIRHIEEFGRIVAEKISERLGPRRNAGKGDIHISFEHLSDQVQPKQLNTVYGLAMAAFQEALINNEYRSASVLTHDLPCKGSMDIAAGCSPYQATGETRYWFGAEMARGAAVRSVASRPRPHRQQLDSGCPQAEAMTHRRAGLSG